MLSTTRGKLWETPDSHVGTHSGLQTPAEVDYKPEHEWYEDSEHYMEDGEVLELSEDSRPSSLPRIFRLHAHCSDILPRTQTLAVIDDLFRQLELGRDVAPPGSEVPRLRLKEMAVSKLHGTIFWSEEHSQWEIVDMGSKHGTFVHMSKAAMLVSETAGPYGGNRLSESRIASLPHPIHHLSCLSLGSTSFEVHIHADLPCDTCIRSIDKSSVIPVSSLQKLSALQLDSVNTTGKRKRVDDTPVKFRTSLQLLKKTLLSQARTSSIECNTAPSTQYVDRSARRRALYPSTSADATGTISPALTSTLSLKSTPTPILKKLYTVPPEALPVVQDSIGHRLLRQQGWVPGTALGMAEVPLEDPESPLETATGARIRLVEPLQVRAQTGRRGLGAASDTASTTDETAGWRDAGKRRRWEAVERG